MPRLPLGPRAATQPVHPVKEHAVKEQAPGILVYVEGKARLLAFEQLVTQALKHVPHANPPAMHPAPAAHVLLCVPAAGKLKSCFICKPGLLMHYLHGGAHVLLDKCNIAFRNQRCCIC